VLMAVGPPFSAAQSEGSTDASLRMGLIAMWDKSTRFATSLEFGDRSVSILLIREASPVGGQRP
jgi:hypothetical protein